MFKHLVKPVKEQEEFILFQHMISFENIKNKF